MSAPEKIEAQTTSDKYGWESTFTVNGENFTDFEFEPTSYIRQDIHQVAIAERDATIAKLKQLDSEAATHVESQIGQNQAAYYRAIAKGKT